MGWALVWFAIGGVVGAAAISIWAMWSEAMPAEDSDEDFSS